jgi:hypothetical protein
MPIIDSKSFARNPSQLTDPDLATLGGVQRSRLEPALGSARANHLPGRYVGKALKRNGPEIAVLEEGPPSQLARARCDHHGTRLGQRAWSRAARFGVSPTTACSWEAPAPRRSPTITSPVAIPIRTCNGDTFSAVELRHRLYKRQNGALGVMFVRSRSRRAHRRPYTWRRNRPLRSTNSVQQR